MVGKCRQYIGIIDPKMVNLDPTNEKKLKSIRKCYDEWTSGKGAICREKMFRKIPMLYRTECLKQSEDSEQRREFNLRKYCSYEKTPKWRQKPIDVCCPIVKEVQNRDYILVSKVEGGRFIVHDGNHRLKIAQEKNLGSILAVIEDCTEE